MITLIQDMPKAAGGAEHVTAREKPPPDSLYLCGRCKRGVLVFLGTGDETVYEPSATRPHAWCYVCGARDGICHEYVLVLRDSNEGT